MITSAEFTVGAFVLGATDSPRALVRHEDLLFAYADGSIDDHREAYLSHFIFGTEMREYFAANRKSVAGFIGACCCRYLVLDIDRPDLSAALLDARKLVAFLHQRYPVLEGDVPIYFSGGKGFHVLLELTHKPPPTARFPAVSKKLAEGIAANAGVTLDTGIFFSNALVRLPNTKHPRSGLYKRRVDASALFRLDISGILEHARHPAADGLPSARLPSEELVTDWLEAEERAVKTANARVADRRKTGAAPDVRAPKYLMDLLRFGVEEGERHKTLFRCAAWLTEQGAPPSLCIALLTESGRDMGLMPMDVDRQIRCGIEHAERQRSGTIMPNWFSGTGAEVLPPDAFDFPFGLLAPSNNKGGGA